MQQLSSTEDFSGYRLQYRWVWSPSQYERPPFIPVHLQPRQFTFLHGIGNDVNPSFDDSVGMRCFAPCLEQKLDMRLCTCIRINKDIKPLSKEEREHLITAALITNTLNIF